jgi:hypothetical protein
MIPAFAGQTMAELPVVCETDSTSATFRYFDALEGGDVSLNFLFSGTILYEATGVGPQIAPIPWDREARYRFPVSIWKGLSAEPARS